MSVKKTLGFFLFLFAISFTNAQTSYLKWVPSVEKKSDTEYTLILKAELKENWYLYSQKEVNDGPIPTSFTFENAANNFDLIGKTSESESTTKFDKIFGMELSFFEEEAIFKQKIKLLNPEIKTIKIVASYQMCDDKECIFEPEDIIVVSLDGSKVVLENKEVTKESLKLTNDLKLDLKKKDTFLKKTKDESKKKGLFGIFLLGFLGGLIALLTPCVFPMIPLTVAFFTKQSKSKGISNALLYGFFIILIYFLLSLPFHLMDSLDPEILNSISTNVWLNIIFFVIFVFFAGSFFGFYELTLPSSWGNKADTVSNSGGLIGVFFMALTLAIVSFSCTGPILGSLLVGSLTADGGAIQLSAGMVGFGVALALPFTLFALFPSWLNSLPKSGGWLTTVKVTLGFLELALALKFLSNADLVEHWGILKREVFLGLWILIFGGLAFYLFGKIKFPHDSPNPKLSKPRIGLGIITAAFTVYLISGLFFNTSLKALSGFPPPDFYSIFEKETDCPLNLNCFKDFDEGLAYAKENNKPIMIDFTGWACVNCRKMEENVWSDPKVYNALEKYVIISLYVDDKATLPKEQQFEFKRKNGQLKNINTIGKKWATFQTVNFETASQPYYILMTPDLELLNYPEKYTDKTTYLNWLEKGLENFK